MPPEANVISISPSNVPAVVKVPEGKLVAHFPFVASVTVQVKVDEIVVLPSARSLNLTVAPAILIGDQVELSSASRILPDAAVLLSLSEKVNSGSVSPDTKFSVLEYAIK